MVVDRAEVERLRQQFDEKQRDKALVAALRRAGKKPDAARKLIYRWKKRDLNSSDIEKILKAHHNA